MTSPYQSVVTLWKQRNPELVIHHKEYLDKIPDANQLTIAHILSSTPNKLEHCAQCGVSVTRGILTLTKRGAPCKFCSLDCIKNCRFV